MSSFLSRVSVATKTLSSSKTMISSLPAALAATTTTTTTSMVQSRNLSHDGHVAVAKFRDVFESYRRTHYTCELPSRFQKEVIKAALHGDSGRIGMDGIVRVLDNIGAKDELTTQELQIIFNELGDKDENDTIPVYRMVQIL